MHLCDFGVPCILQTAYELAREGKHDVHLISWHIWEVKCTSQSSAEVSNLGISAVKYVIMVQVSHISYPLPRYAEQQHRFAPLVADTAHFAHA